MAKPLHRSSDVANFDVYPSGSDLADDPNRLLPEQTESSPLEQYGSQLGSVAGSAVVALRRARHRVRSMSSQKSAKVTDIASARIQDAAARLQDVREQAGARAEELGRSTRARLFEWRRQARNNFYRARIRAREVQNDYPVHVVIGAGIAGLAIGTALRIWRFYRG